MDGGRDRAARYRVRAVDIRKIAQETMEPALRKTLLQVAEDYDQMARRLDALAEADTARSKRNSN